MRVLLDNTKRGNECETMVLGGRTVLTSFLKK
jgi:hypothetical protein